MEEMVRTCAAKEGQMKPAKMPSSTWDVLEHEFVYRHRKFYWKAFGYWDGWRRFNSREPSMLGQKVETTWYQERERDDEGNKAGAQHHR